MPYPYGARMSTSARFNVARRGSLYGLGQDPAGETVVDAAAAAADAAAAAADAAALAVDAATAAPADLQAEVDKLKKENEALKKAMGKFWMGLAVGGAGGYLIGRRRRF